MRITVYYESGDALIGRSVVPGLTYTELRLLDRLSRGGVVTRGALLMSAWSGKTVNWNQASRKVDMAIARLRAKVNHVLNIESVPGEGYRI